MTTTQQVQGLLPIKLKPEYGESDFMVSTCNLEAYKLINSEVAIQWPPNQRVLIVGTKGSGKTHLTKIWAEKNITLRIDETFFYNNDENLNIDLDSKAPTNFNAVSKFTDCEPAGYKAFICENIEKIQDELFLAHIINFAQENSISLLMTCSFLPKFSLPDLNSRLNATYKVLIGEPSPEFARILLQKYFSDYQLKVKKEIIDYIFGNLKSFRFDYIQKLIALIDKMLAHYKKEISISIVRAVMSDIYFKK